MMITIFVRTQKEQKRLKQCLFLNIKASDLHSPSSLYCAPDVSRVDTIVLFVSIVQAVMFLIL